MARRQQRRPPSSPLVGALLLVGALASALLLINAPSAAGFGFITKWKIKGGHGKQVPPTDVATDRAGNVYVTLENRQVQKFTARGDLVSEWVVKGRPARSTGVATDHAGNVYVTGTYGNGASAGHRVEKFTPGGKFISQWGFRGTEGGGIAIDRAGNVYVTVKKWIEKFTAKGAFLGKWTDSGPGALAFDATMHGIATDAAGNVYVTGGYRVTKFTNDGSFVLAWGRNVGGPGVDVCTVNCMSVTEVGKNGTSAEAVGFSMPSGIATDGAEHVYVADSFLQRVQEFNTAGAYLGRLGGYGSGNGQFRSPLGVAADAKGDVYVADHNNYRIQKFGEPSSAFGLGGKATLDQQRGTARLFANLPGVGELTVAGTQIESARRVAKGAGMTALPVIPNEETRAKLETSGSAAVRVQVTYTPTTPGASLAATRSKRVTLIQLPSLTAAVLEGASLRVRLQCPASFEPLCKGRAMAVTARDRCDRREGHRSCRRGTPMTTSAPVRLRPSESKVVRLRVKSEFRHEVAQLARHPGAKSLLIRQLIHAKGFKHGRPQVVFHTYKVQAEKSGG